MSKVVKNPSQMRAKTKAPRPSQGYNGVHSVGKRKVDTSKLPKAQGKKPGDGLDDYTLDLMKLS